jgi:hypothetical protein
MLRLHRFAVTSSLAVTVLALALTTEAQVLPGAGPGAGPGGAMAGGPPPGGMMGMGLGAGQSSPLMILLAPSVQKELKLSEEQKSKVYSFAKKATQRNRELMQTIAFGGGGNPQAMMEASLQIRQEIDQGIAQILDLKQKERFEQIVLQSEGPLAVARPEIAAKLKMSETQQNYVRGVMIEMRRELMMTIRQGAAIGQFNASQVREFAAQLRKEAVKQISQVIDRKQQKTFNSMLGAPFDLSKLEAETASAEASVGGGGDPSKPGDGAQSKDAPAAGTQNGTDASKDASPATRKKGRARTGSGSSS